MGCDARPSGRAAERPSGRAAEMDGGAGATDLRSPLEHPGGGLLDLLIATRPAEITDRTLSDPGAFIFNLGAGTRRRPRNEPPRPGGMEMQFGKSGSSKWEVVVVTG